MNMYELKSYWVAGCYTNFTKQRLPYMQNDFVVTNLFKVIMTNRKATIEQTEGIQIFGIYETQDKAQAAVDEMKELQK